MLLDEIIGLLGDENGSLTDALLKTKILLHQIGRKELVQWVNNELNGYADDSDVPSYRVIPSHVVGNVSNVAWRAESQPLPIQHLDKEYQAHLEKAELRQSLAVVEKLASSKGAFIRRIPLEANHLFDKGLGNGFRTENIWCETSRMDIVNVLVQVRSRLLDFMLELRDNVGQSATETELREKSTTFDAQSMFQQCNLRSEYDHFNRAPILHYGNSNGQRTRARRGGNKADHGSGTALTRERVTAFGAKRL